MSREPRFRIMCLSLALATVIAAAGCSSSKSTASDTTSTTTSGTGAVDAITIKNFGFGASITVSPGTTVTVKNSDPTTHTVAADDKAFDTGEIAGGSSKTFAAPMQPGTYKFHCNIHNYMQGSLTVSG